MNLDKVMQVQAMLLAQFMNAVNQRLTTVQQAIAAALNNPDVSARCAVLEGLGQQVSATALDEVVAVRTAKDLFGETFKKLVADESQAIVAMRFYAGDRDKVTGGLDSARILTPGDLLGAAKLLFDSLANADLHPQVQLEGSYVVIKASAK